MTMNIAGIIDKYQGIAPNQVIAAVQKAAARTGVDFAYLMDKASAESSFDTKATSKTSSATGLFQFIDSTWLKMVKDYGAKFGLGDLADKIEIKDGKACVGSCAVKDEILSLRKNPEISALMAGVYAKENQDYLARHTAGDVGETELYLAHFFGAGSAAKFINARAENGGQTAAEIFPRAARANKGVFFDPATHTARTLDQVYAFFDKKFDSDTTNTGRAAPASAAVSVPSPKADPAPAPAPVLAAAPPAAGQAPSSSAPFRSPASVRPAAAQQPARLSPASVLAMSEMQSVLIDMMELSALPSFSPRRDRFGYNA